MAIVICRLRHRRPVRHARPAGPSLAARSLVLDGPHDRQPAGDPGRIGGRQHRHGDAEHEGQPTIGHGIAGRRDRAGRRPARPSAPPTTSPSDDAERARPPDPRMPASTTTERQTWRRVIPAARRMPISRTRSMTFMVSVLTMPSAAMITATSASASNSPKIRPSASLMAPSIRSSGDDLEGETRWPTLVERIAGGRLALGCEADGEARRRRRRRGGRSRRSSRRASPRRLARAATARRCPRRAGRGVRRRSSGRPGSSRPSGRVASARAAGTIVAPPASSAARAAARSPATNAGRPSAGQVGADRPPRRRSGRRRSARSKVAIGLTRATPGTLAARSVVEASRRRRPGGSRSRTSSPGMTSAIQPAAAARACCADPAEGDDHGEPDGQRRRGSAPSGSGRGRPRPARAAPRTGGARRTARRRRGRRPAARTGERAWRRAGRVDERGPARAPAPPAAARPGRAGRRARPRRTRRRASAGGRVRAPGSVEPRLERLDRLDPAGAPGRLEGGREGDHRRRRRRATDHGVERQSRARRG